MAKWFRNDVHEKTLVFFMENAEGKSFSEKDIEKYVRGWCNAIQKHFKFEDFAVRRNGNSIEVRPLERKEDFIAMKTTFCELKSFPFGLGRRARSSRDDLEKIGFTIISKSKEDDIVRAVLSAKAEVERSI